MPDDGTVEAGKTLRYRDNGDGTITDLNTRLMCRKGKGTLAASDRLMQFLRRITANGRRPAWALTLDVASFFPSIHKATLFTIIARRIKGPEILWLTRTILFHDPTTHYRFRSLDRHAAKPGTAGYPIPAQKSLFGKGSAPFSGLTTVRVSGPS